MMFYGASLRMWHCNNSSIEVLQLILHYHQSWLHRYCLQLSALLTMIRSSCLLQLDKVRCLLYLWCPVAWCGVCVAWVSQLPPPPPSFLADWEISIWLHCSKMSQHKTYVWRFGGKPPLCWDFCCNADQTSLPAPACRGCCGLVLLGDNNWSLLTGFYRTQSGRCLWRHVAVGPITEPHRVPALAGSGPITDQPSELMAVQLMIGWESWGCDFIGRGDEGGKILKNF